MDLTPLAEQVREAATVVPVGSRTHWEVGGAVVPPGAAAAEVRAPAGVVRHDPADLTVTVGAGTTVAELSDVLAAHGQECALDPRDPSATVGGLLACGLSGHRRLRYGPVRDRVLEVRFVTGDARIVRGGGPTVKNVSGYDVPRLLVGSLGTLGVLGEVTLRCQPLPKASVWLTGGADPFELRRRLFRPSSILWDGSHVWVLLEGHPADVDSQARATGLRPSDAGEGIQDVPPWPVGSCRGRISVRPGALARLGPDLDAVPGLRWLAEVGVGTVHVASDDPAAVTKARAVATSHGGWLLREAGPVEPFADGHADADTGADGQVLPNAGVARRLKAALDPEGKLSPGRLPL